MLDGNTGLITAVRVGIGRASAEAFAAAGAQVMVTDINHAVIGELAGRERSAVPRESDLHDRAGSTSSTGLLAV